MTGESQITGILDVAKRGGPRGNRHAQRHGLRSAQLPRGCGYIKEQVDELRKGLEAATLAAKGHISVPDAAAINTACRAEVLASLAARWLRKSFDDMNHDQRLSYQREVVKASEARDKAIDRLGLDKPPDPFAQFARHALAARAAPGPPPRGPALPVGLDDASGRPDAPVRPCANEAPDEQPPEPQEHAN